MREARREAPARWHSATQKEGRDSSVLRRWTEWVGFRLAELGVPLGPVLGRGVSGLGDGGGEAGEVEGKPDPRMACVQGARPPL